MSTRIKLASGDNLYVKVSLDDLKSTCSTPAGLVQLMTDDDEFVLVNPAYIVTAVEHDEDREPMVVIQ